ncbi:MAG: hypothetical protein Q6L68_08820 [Thermostichus sp. DG02_5_bins_236]
MPSVQNLMIPKRRTEEGLAARNPLGLDEVSTFLGAVATCRDWAASMGFSIVAGIAIGIS